MANFLDPFVKSSQTLSQIEREPPMSCSTLLPNRLRLSFFSALLVGLLALSLPIAPAGPAHAASVVYVVPGGAGAQTGADWANAKDLQDALTAATSGDQIWVKAGTYKPTTG